MTDSRRPAGDRGNDRQNSARGREKLDRNDEEADRDRSYDRGDIESGEWRGHGDVDPEWRDGFGSYGFSETRSRPRPRTGYGEQGFGAGEGRGGNWGGGPRGGYGGGEPGGTHGMRGGGWSAEGERFEQGRSPRSFGADGWSGQDQHGRGWGRAGRSHRAPVRGPVAPREMEARSDYGRRDAPWTQSEFAGRGEFGSMEADTWEPGTGRSTRGPIDPERGHSRHWDVPGPYTGRGPQGYRRSESAIREDVCERLTRHGLLDASRITVQVENGEVTLEGTVDSRPCKRMAEDAAETVSGVRDVHNRLRVEPGA